MEQLDRAAIFGSACSSLFRNALIAAMAHPIRDVRFLIPSKESSMQERFNKLDAYVEFTYRVYSDGRRIRSARVFEVDEGGAVRPGPRRPEGTLAHFVREAIGEAATDMAGTSRRVAIDERDSSAARRERKMSPREARGHKGGRAC